MSYPRKRLYIPITRSGSSILASIFTQLIDAARRQRHEEVMERLHRGEITPWWAFVTLHPIFSIWVICMFLVIIHGLF